MTWKPDYALAAELAAYLLPAGQSPTTKDSVNIALAITAASRAIDKESNRQFGLTGSAVARVYTYDGLYIEGRPAIEVDDLMTSVGLVFKVDTNADQSYGTTLTLGTDFDMWPRNAPANGKPWTHIVFRRSPAAYMQRWAAGVQVTANWGWSAVPTEVKQACLIQAGRFFVRNNALFGIAGSPEIGSEMRLLDRLDPDVALIVGINKRWWGVMK